MKMEEKINPFIVSRLQDIVFTGLSSLPHNATFLGFFFLEMVVYCRLS